LTTEQLIIIEKIMNLKGFVGNDSPLRDEDIEFIGTLNKAVWPLNRVKPILQFVALHPTELAFITEV
jgi:hypothetical protein